jgi:hypothetical protein
MSLSAAMLVVVWCCDIEVVCRKRSSLSDDTDVRFIEVGELENFQVPKVRLSH